MASIEFVDHSGLSSTAFENPYDALLAATAEQPNQSAAIQERYELHRTARNAQQKAIILDLAFRGWDLDPYLIRLDGPRRDPEYQDPRWNVCFWARPPAAIKQLASTLQDEVRKLVPHIWMAPPENLHMTVLEVITAANQPITEGLVAALLPCTPQITNYTLKHRVRLIKPLLSYDPSALALTFLPAAGEPVSADVVREHDESYTYHHLRRDVHGLAAQHVAIKPRYVLLSSHMSLGRHIVNDDIVKAHQPEDATIEFDHTKLERFVERIEELNKWLQLNFWPGKEREAEGTWWVGQEHGLDFRAGQLWYGGGVTICKGEGY